MTIVATSKLRCLSIKAKLNDPSRPFDSNSHQRHPAPVTGLQNFTPLPA